MRTETWLRNEVHVLLYPSVCVEPGRDFNNLGHADRVHHHLRKSGGAHTS